MLGLQSRPLHPVLFSTRDGTEDLTHARHAPCQLNQTFGAVIGSQMCLLKFAILVGVSIAMRARTPWPKNKVGGKGLACTFISLITIGGSQDRDRAGTWRQGWRRGHGGTLLTDLLPMACLACYSSRTQTTSQGWPHPQWAGPASVSH